MSKTIYPKFEIWQGESKHDAKGIVRQKWFWHLVARNGRDGISVGGSNLLVQGNKAGENVGAGIRFDTSNHIYRDNILRGNRGGAVAGDGAADVTDAGGNVE